MALIAVGVFSTRPTPLPRPRPITARSSRAPAARGAVRRAIETTVAGQYPGAGAFETLRALGHQVGLPGPGCASAQVTEDAFERIARRRSCGAWPRRSVDGCTSPAWRHWSPSISTTARASCWRCARSSARVPVVSSLDCMPTSRADARSRRGLVAIAPLRMSTWPRPGNAGAAARRHAEARPAMAKAGRRSITHAIRRMFFIEPCKTCISRWAHRTAARLCLSLPRFRMADFANAACGVRLCRMSEGDRSGAPRGRGPPMPEILR